MIMIAALTVLVPGQERTRIRFSRGSYSATVSGSLNGFEQKRSYLLRVRKGQTIRTEQTGRYSDSHLITIYISDPNGEGVGDSDASCNERREISPTVAGDYLITVVECQKADPWKGRFTFRVSVR